MDGSNAPKVATSLSDQVGARRWRAGIWQALICLAAVALVVLLADCFDTNEADKLPLALQRIQPGFLPADWYLNQPQPHQWLFLDLAGRVLHGLGFVAGSLLIRLAGYALWCWGVVALAMELGLALPWLLAALALWLPRQGMVAGEWVLGSAEPKTFAYALLLLAFVSWRRGRAGWGGLQAGLACSAHVLVGGYGAITLAALAWLRSHQHRWRWWLALAGVLLGAFALYQPVLGRLSELAASTPDQAQRFSADWLYVVFRHPHHLVPASWRAGWLAVVLVLLGWGWLGRRLARGADLAFPAAELQACRDLWLWSALALVPFGLGLLVSLVHPESWLVQLYPFRFADTLVPLALVLLGARALQTQIPLPRWLAAVGLPVLLGISAVLSTHGTVLRPGQAYALPADKAELYEALMAHTTQGERVLTPPGGFSDLALRTRRAQVVQFRQVPGSMRALGEWAKRLAELSGGAAVLQAGPGGAAAERRLVEAYGQLKPEQLAALARRHGVVAVVTHAGQAGPPGWHRVLRASPWWLWLPGSPT